MLLMLFESLLGKTLTSIRVMDDAVYFYCSDNTSYELYHEQESCEDVYIEDVIGDINDLLNLPLLQAEEEQNFGGPFPKKGVGDYDSYSWTFYKLATNKGRVTIRWFGSSNGCYSESVSFRKINLK